MSSVSKSNALILSILHNPTILKEITGLTVKYSTTFPNNSKLRSFLALRLPVLKFHNEFMKIQVEKFRNTKEKSLELKQYRPTIEILKRNGEIKTLFADEMADDGQIFQEIIKIDRGE